MIKITMGGYLDKNDRVMTRAELNEAISEMQDENKYLKERVNIFQNYFLRDSENTGVVLDELEKLGEVGEYE